MQRVGCSQQAERVEAQIGEPCVGPVEADGFRTHRTGRRQVGEIEHGAVDRDQRDRADVDRRHVDRQESRQEPWRTLRRRRLAPVDFDAGRFDPCVLRPDALPEQGQDLEARLQVLDRQGNEFVLQLDTVQGQSAGDRAADALDLQLDLADAFRYAGGDELQAGFGVGEIVEQRRRQCREQ